MLMSKKIFHVFVCHVFKFLELYEIWYKRMLMILSKEHFSYNG